MFFRDPRPCDIVLQRQDNTACITSLERGWSQKMSLTPIVYRVNIMWAAERIAEQRVRVIHERTNRMLADPLTKLTSPQVLYDRGLILLPAPAARPAQVSLRDYVALVTSLY